MVDLNCTIVTTATGPKSVSVDGTKIDAQSIYELVKADQHLAAKDGVAVSRHRGIRFSKITPPGTTA